MSIIQTIREKGAKISVVLIALALVGFILTDYFSGRGRNAMGGGSNTVGSVNGKSISYDDFKMRVDQAEAQIKQQPLYQYQQMSPAALQKAAVDQAWGQEVGRVLYRQELNRLGMRIGKKERGDILYGPNAPEDIKKAGTDPNTGQYDPIRAKQMVDQKMKGREWSQQQKNDFNRYIGELDEYRLQEKYNSLFSNSVNYPRWFVEKQTNDNTQLASVSMIKMLYTDSVLGPDSLIKISDKEISDYINKHKDQFKQERSRSINFVTFSASPTRTDTLAAKKSLMDLKPEADTANDVSLFAGRDVTFEAPDIYFSPDQLPPTGKDSITRLNKNAVYGPYLEGGTYVMVKLLDTKILPDSVKCRHVLVGTNPEEGGVDDSTASKRIDSIKNAIERTGASWAAMVEKYNPTSDGSRQTKGEMTFASSQIQSGMQTGNFAKEFGQFVLFDGKPGSRKVVKTSFGYHYIEILSFIKPQTNYKVAFFAQEIVPSEQTDNDAQHLANAFFGDTKDQKTFDAAYEKMVKPAGGTKGVGANIGPLDAEINSMGGAPLSSRSFVMNIYKAKRGEVLQPEKVGSSYVVAIVTEVNEEGTQSVAQARPFVEYTLRQKKKAEMIKQKIGTVTTLEDVAGKLGKTIETVDSIRMDTRTPSAKLPNEPRVLGAIFNPANKGKVITEPIVGFNGVYVIRVENIGATASTEANVEEQRKSKYQTGKNQQLAPIEAIKKSATIKDKRAERF